MQILQKTIIFARTSLLLLAMGLSVGCAESNVRDSKEDAEFDHSLTDQARKLRSHGDDDARPSFGVSDQARDIEKDFGIK